MFLKKNIEPPYILWIKKILLEFPHLFRAKDIFGYSYIVFPLFTVN